MVEKIKIRIIKNEKIKQKTFFAKFLLPKNTFYPLLVGLVSAGLFSSIMFAFALPYAPGETTDPTCLPTDQNCTVTAAVPYTGAMASVDLGAKNLTTTGAGSFSSLNLTQSALSVGNGGTGVSSFTPYGILYASALDSLSQLALGSAGQVLISNGSGSAPSWSTVDLSGLNYLNQAVKTSSSPTFANITDSALTSGRVALSGTGGQLADSANLTFNTTDGLGVANSGDAQILSSTGNLILGGTGLVNNENLKLDFETTPNQIAATSDTGVSVLNLGTIALSSGSYISGSPIVSSVITSGPPGTSPADGAVVVDSGDGGRLYFRYGGAWHYTAQTGGFQIPASETADPISGDQMKEGDIVLGMVNQTLDDKALHAIWVKWDSVKADLIKEIKNQGLNVSGSVGSGDVAGVDSSTFSDKVSGILSSFGISIKNGITNIAQLAVEKSTTDVARINKMEMVDSVTGDIYCTWIQNGEWVKVKGECSSISAVNALAQPTSTEQVIAQAQGVVQQAQNAVKQTQQAVQQAQQAADQAAQSAQQAQQTQNSSTTQQDTNVQSTAITQDQTPSTSITETVTLSDQADLNQPLSGVTSPSVSDPTAELINNAAGSLVTGVWNFIKWIFLSFGNSTASLLQSVKNLNHK